MVWVEPEAVDTTEARVLKAHLALLAEGVRPTHRKVRDLALVGGSTVTRCFDSLQEKGWIVAAPREGAEHALYQVHPKAWSTVRVKPPRWKGRPDKLQDVKRTAQSTYKKIEEFFLRYHHVPGPSDLAPIIGHTRQRAHQVLTELRRKGALPSQAEVGP